MANRADTRTVLTPQELVEKLAADIEAVLQLRGQTHYKLPRPDEVWEDHDEIPDGAWATWADHVYEINNRMGGYLGDAENIIAALRRYVAEVEDDDWPDAQ